MAPPHLQTHDSYNARYENNRDIAVLSDLGWGYRKMAQQRGMPVSTVQGVVKGNWERSSTSVHDAPRSSRPTIISPIVQQRIEPFVEENPKASLSQITEQLQDLDIGRYTIDKVINNLYFKLKIPQKNLFLDAFQKVRRRYIQTSTLLK